jgi:hypothetical protein
MLCGERISKPGSCSHDESFEPSTKRRRITSEKARERPSGEQMRQGGDCAAPDRSACHEGSATHRSCHGLGNDEASSHSCCPEGADAAAKGGKDDWNADVQARAWFHNKRETAHQTGDDAREATAHH